MRAQVAARAARQAAAELTVTRAAEAATEAAAEAASAEAAALRGEDARGLGSEDRRELQGADQRGFDGRDVDARAAGVRVDPYAGARVARADDRSGRGLGRPSRHDAEPWRSTARLRKTHDRGADPDASSTTGADAGMTSAPQADAASTVP